jgi:hypothetical protein
LCGWKEGSLSLSSSSFPAVAGPSVKSAHPALRRRSVGRSAGQFDRLARSRRGRRSSRKADASPPREHSFARESFHRTTTGPRHIARHGSSQPSSATQKVRRRGASSSPSPPRARATRSRSAFGGGTSFPSRAAPAPRRRRARRPRDRSARVDALDAIPRVVRSDIDRLRRRSRRPPRRTRVARPARSGARNGPFRPSLVRPTSYSTRRPPAATDDEPTDASPTHPSKRRPASSSSASITRGRRPS